MARLWELSDWQKEEALFEVLVEGAQQMEVCYLNWMSSDVYI